MPIRHGGRLASRASTWPRDHFCRSTIVTVLILANDVERVLADIDADYGGRSVELFLHGVALSLVALPAFAAGRGGARAGPWSGGSLHFSGGKSRQQRSRGHVVG